MGKLTQSTGSGAQALQWYIELKKIAGEHFGINEFKGEGLKGGPAGGPDPIDFPELVGEAGNPDESEGDQCRVVPWLQSPVNGTAPSLGGRDRWPRADPSNPTTSNEQQNFDVEAYIATIRSDDPVKEFALKRQNRIDLTCEQLDLIQANRMQALEKRKAKSIQKQSEGIQEGYAESKANTKYENKSAESQSGYEAAEVKHQQNQIDTEIKKT